MVLSTLCLWAGATMVLSRHRWFARVPLVDRLRPYTPGGGRGGAGGVLSVTSFRDVLGPVASSSGARVARLFGIHEHLATRLARLHSPVDPAAFRLRQLAWATGGFGAGAAAAVIFRLDPLVGLVLTLGSPLLAFLVVEQRSVAQSDARKQRVLLELPIVAEQLGMLLSAGYSMGGALNRLAARGQGASGQDLRRVCRRIRQGLSEVEALREWAELADLPPLERLVSILALNHEAGDLGKLIGDEARNIRRDVQRQLIETIEKRAQQVWVPVTVATLVPGVLFIAVPFIEALQVFSGG
jgi:tight adherence protein C